MASILVVDDAQAEQVRISRLLAGEPSYEIHTTGSGQDSLDFLAAHPVDLVVTDLRMPQMDGLELLDQLQEAYPRVPVILMAGQGTEELTVKAIQQGASGYLNKQASSKQLHAMVKRLLAARATDLAHAELLKRQELEEYEFKLPSRRVLMSATAGFLRQKIQASEICPEKELLRLGIALEEALLNACMHGNLELDSELREEDGDLFEALADQRTEISPWKDRYVYVSASVTQEQARIMIRDEGRGFDPASLPDPTDPENLLKPHGRGVMIMKLFMDEVTWNSQGNQVTMIKHASDEDNTADD